MKNKIVLDAYEDDILKSYENGEWQSVDDLEEKKEEYANIVKSTLKKNKVISIKLSEKDYIDIHSKSIEENIPYQTLISSIIHKYLTGKLIEKVS